MSTLKTRHQRLFDIILILNNNNKRILKWRPFWNYISSSEASMFWLRCNKIMAHLEIIPSSISQGRLTVNANHDSLTFMVSWFCFQEVIIKREIPQQLVWDFTLSWHLDGCRLLPSSDWSIVITSLVFIECRLCNKHFTMSTENSRSVFWHCSALKL